jgi:hypothetical protein
MKLSALSKIYDPAKNPRMYFLLVAGIFLTVMQYYISKDIFSTISVGISFAVLYWILSKPQKVLEIDLTEDGITMIDDSASENSNAKGQNSIKPTPTNPSSSKNEERVFIKWQNCLSWSLLNLGDIIEVCIETNNWRQRFYYFYISENDSFDEKTNLQDMIVFLGQYAQYDEKNLQRDLIHVIFRNLGLE